MPIERRDSLSILGVQVVMPQDLHRIRADERGTILHLRSGEVLVLHPSVVRLAYYSQVSPPSPSPQVPRVPSSAQHTEGGRWGWGRARRFLSALGL